MPRFTLDDDDWTSETTSAGASPVCVEKGTVKLHVNSTDIGDTDEPEEAYEINYVVIGTDSPLNGRVVLPDGTPYRLQRLFGEAATVSVLSTDPAA